MSKHNIETKQGQDHVAMKQIGSLVFAARVHKDGGWVSIANIWEDKLRKNKHHA
jgi:hypothetical protein